MVRLSDILKNGNGDELQKAWEETEAAGDFEPLPKGKYIARITGGELSTSRGKGTPCYKLTFKVLEGEYQGRLFWLDIWLTTAALAMAKRDLGKIGVTSFEQLEQPIPPGIRCSVNLGLRKNDDGTEFNRVISFEVLGIGEIEKDAFDPENCEPETKPVDDQQNDHDHTSL